MIDLTAIREAAGLSPAQVGWKMGRKGGSEVATNIKRMESQESWRTTALVSYLQACGADAEMVVKVNGQEFRFLLTD